MTFLSGSCNDTRASYKFVANCLMDSRRKKLYQQSCLQQTINKLHKVITYFIFTASIFKTLVSILQRVIRRDKHPHHVIRTDQPSLLWLRPQRVIKNVSFSRGTLNYSLDVLDVSDVYIYLLYCYTETVKSVSQLCYSSLICQQCTELLSDRLSLLTN
jgi:hypothetical protein